MQPSSPRPTEGIDLAPVRPRLAEQRGEPAISEDESRENLGRGLRNGFWIACGMWLGAAFVIVLVLS